MYFVYILQSAKDGRTYVGHTKDLEKRLAEHNAGRVSSTAYRRPLKLIKYEKFDSAKVAKLREIWWKSSAGRKKLKIFFSMLSEGTNISTRSPNEKKRIQDR
jgi:putative endonuclease